ARCAQCDGNHHSLSSQCESIKAYNKQLKEEVDNALARGVVHRQEKTKQTSNFNPEDFPPLHKPNQNIIPVWGSKLPKHQVTTENTEIAGILNAFNKQLSIMTDTNIRMEKKLEEMDTNRKQDEEVVELLQKTMRNMIYSIREMMEIMVNPLCEQARIQVKRKYLPFTNILEDLQAGVTNKTGKKTSDLQKEDQTNKDKSLIAAASNQSSQ
ncbi:unnamed protein product, partial [Rotaria magnacalcarata]